VIDMLLRGLEATALATAVRENDFLFPCVETVHVLAVTMVVGSIAIVDLRLMGLASLDRAVSRVTADVLPITWGAFAVAAATGFLLFSAKAVAYSHNVFLISKLVLVGLAGLNMGVFHVLGGPQRCGSHALPPINARLAGGLSLTLWVAVVACGRCIGFTLH
jgi:hypothetical protein